MFVRCVQLHCPLASWLPDCQRLSNSITCGRLGIIFSGFGPFLNTHHTHKQNVLSLSVSWHCVASCVYMPAILIPKQQSTSAPRTAFFTRPGQTTNASLAGIRAPVFKPQKHTHTLGNGGLKHFNTLLSPANTQTRTATHIESGNRFYYFVTRLFNARFPELDFSMLLLEKLPVCLPSVASFIRFSTLQRRRRRRPFPQLIQFLRLPTACSLEIPQTPVSSHPFPH